MISIELMIAGKGYEKPYSKRKELSTKVLFNFKKQAKKYRFLEDFE